MTKLAARRRGFTLIELLIVIVVIAILALIVIPRVMGAGRKAREATLKANLHQLRNAIEQFQADTGGYPLTLDALTARTAPATSGGVLDDNAAATTYVGGWQGPYLPTSGGLNNTGIPVNPFLQPSDSNYDTVSSHWSYPVTGKGGEIHPGTPTTGDTLDGIPFSEL